MFPRIIDWATKAISRTINGNENDDIAVREDRILLTADGGASVVSVGTVLFSAMTGSMAVNTLPDVEASTVHLEFYATPSSGGALNAVPYIRHVESGAIFEIKPDGSDIVLPGSSNYWAYKIDLPCVKSASEWGISFAASVPNILPGGSGSIPAGVAYIAKR